MTSRVKTFNVVFEHDHENDERVWAQRVSKHFNTEHYEIEVSERQAFEFFERMTYHLDEPLADWVCLPLYFIARLAKQHDVTVVQCGEGADELFCGYTAYAHYCDVYRRWWNPTQRYLPSVIRNSMAYVGMSLFRKDIHKQEHLLNWSKGRNMFWGGALGFRELAKKMLVNQNYEEVHDDVVKQIYPDLEVSCDSYNIVKYHLDQLMKHNPKADFLEQITYLEFKNRLPELLLMRLDKMTMAASVEGRVPYLDHHLVEKGLKISSDLKYRKGITKYILKKACEGIIPNDIIYRPKKGFSAPMSSWFRKGKYFRSHFESLLQNQGGIWNELLRKEYIERLLCEHKAGVKDWSPQLWTLQNLMSYD